ncbi:hypothetical protein GCM10009809_32420 [Isoptericola hypogeus]|uniref:Uncharacterized protein n=1 Tax=Isoptericola hypogeus TaxID=300179 RepID=A0ABP4VTF5_9MICO
MTDNRNAEVAYLPPAVPPTNHGHTVAAWFTMIGIMVGAIVAAVGVTIAAVWLFWVGMGIVVVANVIGLVLRNMGYGQARSGAAPRREPAAH